MSYFRLVDESGSYDVALPPPVTLGRSLLKQPFGTVETVKNVSMLYLGGGANLSRKHCCIRYDGKEGEYRMDVLGKNGLWSEDDGHVSKADKNQPVVSIALRSGLPLVIGLKKMYFQLPIFRASGTTPKNKKRKSSGAPTSATVAARKKPKPSSDTVLSMPALRDSSSDAVLSIPAFSLSPPPPPPSSAPPADATSVPEHVKPTAKYHVLARDIIAQNPVLADGKGVYTIRHIADAIAVAHPYFKASPESMKRLVGGLRRNFGRLADEFVKQPAKPGQQSKVCYYVWQRDGAGDGASVAPPQGATPPSSGAADGAAAGAPASPAV
jgi:hypothetical protein